MKALLVLFLLIGFAFSKNYYISKENGKISIITDGIPLPKPLNEIIKNSKKGDKFFFKRGDYFKTSIEIKNKENLLFSSFGNPLKPPPIIDARTKIIIDEKSLEILYNPQIEEWKDESWRNLLNDFKNLTRILSTKTREQIAKNFDEVRYFVSQIARFKLPLPKYGYYDPNAMRIFNDSKEILRALFFEELKCENCKNKIRWYFEKKSGYLYLFSLSPSIDLKKAVENLYINNNNLSAFSIINSKNIEIFNLDLKGGKYALLIKGSKKIKASNLTLGNYSFIGAYLTSNENPSSDIKIEKCKIDSNFPFDYRFYSSRGSQDGVFLIGDVNNSTVTKCDIYNWGHSGITLYAPTIKHFVSKNTISLNKISGKNTPYMHGIIVDNKNCTHNKIVENLISDISAPNQLNGIENIFSKNIIMNVKNSKIKKDQGYGSGIAIQIQAYGENAAINNLIKDNSIYNCDQCAISIYDNGRDGEKRGNKFIANTFSNCSLSPFNTKEKNIFIEISKKNKDKIIDNIFVNNLFYNKKSNPLINYKGSILDINSFNQIKGNENNKIIPYLSVNKSLLIYYFEQKRRD